VSADSRTAVLGPTEASSPESGKDSRVAAWTHGAISAGLAILWFFFAWASFATWRKTGRPAGAGAVVLELVLVVLFLARRAPKESSKAPLDWFATIAAFTLLVARPVTDYSISESWLFEVIQFVGVAGSLWSLLSLGRSFGLVASNRGLQTRGPYRFVRHPIYAFYFFVWIGYLLESPSTRNFVVFSAAALCQFVRIYREEKFLRRDPAYEPYCRAVRYRLVPGIY
jgi:protein-S-isoprenylcysteine O-methyltransferase Ste14